MLAYVFVLFAIAVRFMPHPLAFTPVLGLVRRDSLARHGVEWRVEMAASGGGRADQFGFFLCPE